jgi:hypothetical protein
MRSEDRSCFAMGRDKGPRKPRSPPLAAAASATELGKRSSGAKAKAAAAHPGGPSGALLPRTAPHPGPLSIP